MWEVQCVQGVYIPIRNSLYGKVLRGGVGERERWSTPSYHLVVRIRHKFQTTYLWRWESCEKSCWVAFGCNQVGSNFQSFKEIPLVFISALLDFLGKGFIDITISWVSSSLANRPDISVHGHDFSWQSRWISVPVQPLSNLFSLIIVKPFYFFYLLFDWYDGCSERESWHNVTIRYKIVLTGFPVGTTAKVVTMITPLQLVPRATTIASLGPLFKGIGPKSYQLCGGSSNQVWHRNYKAMTRGEQYTMVTSYTNE